MKHKDIIERANKVGKYIIETKCTIRDAAKQFAVSKSTTHRDIRIILKKYNPVLYQQVMKVLIYNSSVRHLRGGYATRRKYKNIKEVQNNETIKKII